MNKSRRNFMKMTGMSVVGTVAGYATSPSMAAASGLPITYSGTDFTGWEMAIGDGLWAGPGQAWPTTADITTHNYGLESELQANIQERGVMAHNITFKRIIDTTALDAVHSLTYMFRLPELPTTGGGTFNSQTLEGGFFIWDGGNTRLDYGLAFQWILNPWMSSFGRLWTWTDINGGQWMDAGYLQPDLNWHTLEMTFDYQNMGTSIMIDGVGIPCTFSATPKHASWGTETAARFQAEIISLWPGSNPAAPMHRAAFKDWEWIWTPNSGS